MKKNNVVKHLSTAISKMGTKSAYCDLNNACVYFIYQPKLPKAVKRCKCR